MNDALINRIVAVTREQAGPLPDEAAHRRYLETLSPAALTARLDALMDRKKSAPVEFWGGSRGRSPHLEAVLARSEHFSMSPS